MGQIDCQCMWLCGWLLVRQVTFTIEVRWLYLHWYSRWHHWPFHCLSLTWVRRRATDLAVCVRRPSVNRFFLHLQLPVIFWVRPGCCPLLAKLISLRTPPVGISLFGRRWHTSVQWQSWLAATGRSRSWVWGLVTEVSAPLGSQMLAVHTVCHKHHHTLAVCSCLQKYPTAATSVIDLWVPLSSVFNCRLSALM